MKTLSAFLVILFAASAAATAQTATPAAGDSHRVSAGIEGGLSLATLSSYNSTDADEAFDTSFRAGLALGGFVSWPFNRQLSLRLEALFTQKGADITFAGSSRTDVVVDPWQLEIPVLLHFQAESGRVRPFVHAGPTLAFKLRARVDASASGGDPDVDIGDQVQTFDTGLAVGGGIEAGRWSIEGRFVQGLLDIGNTPAVDDPIRTRTFLVISGFRF
jgi:hypothetical protein